MLDLFMKPAAYAEEQTYSQLILGTHVLHRGFNMGAILGTAASLSVASYSRLRKPGYVYSFSHTLRYASRGSVFGLGFAALALTGRMYDKELIEWQDRSWRLLQHPTQNQTDHWSLAGAALGLLTMAAYRTGPAPSPRFLLGGAAVGSSAAIIAMMVYRGARGELKG